MLDVPGISPYFSVDVLEFVRAGLEYIDDDIWPFPLRGELVPALVALDEPEHHVADVERFVVHTSSVRWSAC